MKAEASVGRREKELGQRLMRRQVKLGKARKIPKKKDKDMRRH